MTAPELTSYQIRAELEDLLERDLLGPLDAPRGGTCPGSRRRRGTCSDGWCRGSESTTQDDDPESDPDLVDREVSAPDAGEEDDDRKVEQRFGSDRWWSQPSGRPSAFLRTSPG